MLKAQESRRVKRDRETRTKTDLISREARAAPAKALRVGSHSSVKEERDIHGGLLKRLHPQKRDENNNNTLIILRRRSFKPTWTPRTPSRHLLGRENVILSPPNSREIEYSLFLSLYVPSHRTSSHSNNRCLMHTFR